MATQYTGRMDAAATFTAQKPFVVLGWPSDADVKTFDTEQEAKDFVNKSKKSEKFRAVARLYGFEEGRWVRL